jgi:nitroreductase
MNVIEAIRTRRSIGRVKMDPVDREIVEQLLDAAAWAPNHYMTEPWKFIVMTGDGRQVLGDAYADIAAEQAAGRSEDQLGELRAKSAAKAFRAPVVIAVAVSPAGEGKLPVIEEVAAVHCAVQNLLLAAHELGLGAIWRSGEPMYHPRMLEAFSLPATDQMAGLVYIGYPDMEQPVVNRTPSAAKTVWIG